jgi:hypothetical protein
MIVVTNRIADARAVSHLGYSAIGLNQRLTHITLNNLTNLLIYLPLN